MTAAELAERARQQIHELGEPLDDPTDRTTWAEEQRSAIQLLEALADHNGALLREAALLIPADEAPAARDLLLEAAANS